MTYKVIYNTLQLCDIGIIKLGKVKLAGSHGVIRVYSRGVYCEGHSIKIWKQRWRYKRFKGCAAGLLCLHWVLHFFKQQQIITI